MKKPRFRKRRRAEATVVRYGQQFSFFAHAIRIENIQRRGRGEALLPTLDSFKDAVEFVLNGPPELYRFYEDLVVAEALRSKESAADVDFRKFLRKRRA